MLRKIAIPMMLLMVGFCFLSCQSAPKPNPDASAFGESFSDSDSMSVGQAFQTNKASEGVVLTGQVDKVCKKKGCWMVMKDGKKEIRITFKDYGFFVPVNLVGKNVSAKGNLMRKVISVAEQKHYLEDGGAPQSEIDKITEEKNILTFVASGVKVL